MTFIDHLKELRKRLIVSILASLLGMIVVFTFYTPLMTYLSDPLLKLNSAINNQNMFITSFFEGFTTKLKFSLIGGLIFSFPVHLYNILRFAFPGLQRKEKVLLIFSLISGIALAFFSLYLCYFYLLPYSITFLTTSQFIPSNVGILLNFKQNIFYIFNFLCFAIILFQAPILLHILMYLNLIKRKTLWRSSRYVIVIIFILTALITPPDIISQITLSIPLVILYFLTILIAKICKIGE